MGGGGGGAVSGEWTIGEKRKEKKRQTKQEDKKEKSNDNPEIPDRGLTSNIPGLSSRDLRLLTC